MVHIGATITDTTETRHNCNHLVSSSTYLDIDAFHRLRTAPGSSSDKRVRRSCTTVMMAAASFTRSSIWYDVTDDQGRTPPCPVCMYMGKHACTRCTALHGFEAL
eukprot:352598-Chlamydomonas_euryale.AAC.20